ncbi:hypothetical protein HY495_00975 [Candidatus Woesearchaeota archaeon]|nr:hypothetical protein [Candidatus Woesearchaeota archaeon]
MINHTPLSNAVLQEKVLEQSPSMLEEVITKAHVELASVVPDLLSTTNKDRSPINRRELVRLFGDVRDQVNCLLDAEDRDSCTIDYLDWYSPEVRTELNFTSYAFCGLITAAVFTPLSISLLFVLAAGGAADYGFSKINRKLKDIHPETPLYDSQKRMISVSKRRKTMLAADIAQAYARHLLSVEGEYLSEFSSYSGYSAYKAGFARRVAYFAAKNFAEKEDNQNYLLTPLLKVSEELDEIKTWLNDPASLPSAQALGTAYFWTHPEALIPVNECQWGIRNEP